MIRLLLVDSHTYYRQALGQLCTINGGFDVVAETDNDDEALLLARQYRPDVILIDADLPGQSGFDVVRQIVSETPDQAVLLLTLFGAARLRSEAQRAGIRGVLPKDCDEATLFAAIIAAHDGLKSQRNPTLICPPKN